MLKVTLRGLLAHRVRFALTTFAVVLGVSFVVGVFVLTDSLRASVGDLVGDINAGVDATVRAETAFGDDTRAKLPEDLEPIVAGVPGVAAAEGTVFGYAQLVDKDGDAVTTQGAPLLGFSWGTDDDLYPVSLDQGRKPGPGEIAIDRQTADEFEFELGDEVSVLLAGPSERFTIVGTVKFGETDTLLGARITLFDVDTAQRVLVSEGAFDTIDLRVESGESVPEVLQRVEEALPDGYEVVDVQQVSDEFEDDFQGFLDVFQNALLAFAAIALFVSAFLVNNTFTIVLGQRIRELALLRAVGASPAQVRRSVFGESLVVGVVATGSGILLGLGVAVGLKAFLDSVGFGLPSGPLALAPRTVVAAVAVGVGVTTVASVYPAIRASRVAPLDALRVELVTHTGRRLVRLVVGGVLTGIGVLLLGLGFFGSEGAGNILGAIGLGAVILFIGIALLSPLVAGPVARLLAWPLLVAGRFLPRAFGSAGRLARHNAARNPGRTAATASALMIGLAMVSMALVVGTTFKDSFADTLEQTVRADYIITTESFTGFSNVLADELRARPELGAVSGIRFGSFQVDGETKEFSAVDEPAVGGLVDVDLQAGSTAGFTDGGIIVHEDPAADLGLAVGDSLTVTFPATGEQVLTVVGIHRETAFAGNWIVSLDTWDANFTDRVDQVVMARAADGADLDAARAAVEAAAEPFPQVTIEDRAEFQRSQEAQLDSLLLIVNALVGLAVVIALLGIANTLALSVFERTREIGLLRAVGMSRRQTRRMVRWEAAIVAVFGAVLGVVIGIPLGITAVAALPADFAARAVVPGGQILALVVVAGIAGLAAAFFPARRAARLDVLVAIAHE